MTTSSNVTGGSIAARMPRSGSSAKVMFDLLKLRNWLISGLSLLGGCAATDMMMASTARTSLLGMSELDLATCLGLPDQKFKSGKTTLYTYFANSTQNLGISVPIANGLSLSYNGYCHATFRFEKGYVTEIHYSGETDGFGAKDSICAPIVRSCIESRQG